MEQELEVAQAYIAAKNYEAAFNILHTLGNLDIFNVILIIIKKKNLVSKDVKPNDEEAIHTKEQAILDLGLLLKQTKKAKELGELIVYTRPFLNMVSKAKAAKLVRNLVDMFLDLEAGTGEEVDD
jgi:hypothetical protein